KTEIASDSISNTLFDFTSIRIHNTSHFNKQICSIYIIGTMVVAHFRADFYNQAMMRTERWEL
ncbi:MAG: hypothetical protein AAFQ52_17825, partial [Chloroflexota bacterium]